MTITVTPPSAPPTVDVVAPGSTPATVAPAPTPPTIDVQAGGAMPTLPNGYAFLIAPDGEYLIG